MKFALLIYPKLGSHEALREDEYESVNAEYWALRDDSRCLGGAHLQPADSATTVRYGGDQYLIIDGPFADTKEVLGGYYVVDASNLDGALEFAQVVQQRRRTVDVQRGAVLLSQRGDGNVFAVEDAILVVIMVHDA